VDGVQQDAQEVLMALLNCPAVAPFYTGGVTLIQTLTCTNCAYKREKLTSEHFIQIPPEVATKDIELHNIFSWPPEVVYVACEACGYGQASRTVAWTATKGSVALLALPRFGEAIRVGGVEEEIRTFRDFAVDCSHPRVIGVVTHTCERASVGPLMGKKRLSSGHFVYWHKDDGGWVLVNDDSPAKCYSELPASVSTDAYFIAISTSGLALPPNPTSLRSEISRREGCGLAASRLPEAVPLKHAPPVTKDTGSKAAADPAIIAGMAAMEAAISAVSAPEQALRSSPADRR
jgi:hypothetical protein